MSGITVDDLVNYDSSLANGQQDSWAQLLAGVEESASYLDKNVSGPLTQAWAGTAAELANSKVNTLQGGLISSAQQLTDIHSLLKNFASNMESYSTQMKNALRQADNEGLEVSSDGTVTIPLVCLPGKNSPTKTQQQVAQNQINSILGEANQYDNEVASALQGLLPVTTPKSAGNPVTTVKWTTVSAAGSLWQIAQTQYGNGDLWPEIWKANPNITDPNVIPIGLKVKVPIIADPVGKAPAQAPDPGLPELP